MDTSETQRATTIPGRPTRLEFAVDWPPNHVAAYLIEEPARILIDAGIPGDEGETAMEAELGEAGYDPADLDAVVVTHPHTDHTGQVPLFLEADVPVYAPQPALDQLDRDPDDLTAGVREIGRSLGLDRDRIEREAERARDSLTRNRGLLDPDAAIGFDFDDHVEVAGVAFEPYHTPGHQIHHASLALTVDGERALFSGDALIEPFRAAALHVGIDYGAYEAIDAFYGTVDRLSALDVDRVYPGHGPIFTEYEDVLDYTRNELDDLVDETRDAVDAIGPATPMELVLERVGEIKHPAAMLDTLGALGTLDRRGEITYWTEDGVRYYEEA